MAYKRLSDNETSAVSHCFYVACKCDEQWWVGMVLEVNQASNGIKITFMHPHGSSASLFWPNKDDVC